MENFYNVSFIPMDNRASDSLEILLGKVIDRKRTSGIILRSKLPEGIYNFFVKVAEDLYRCTLEQICHIRYPRKILEELVYFIMKIVMFHNLPFAVMDDGSKIITYSREDIVRWYDFYPDLQRYFVRPIEESLIINVTTRHGTINHPVKLSKEAVLGFAFVSDQHHHVRITLSNGEKIINLEEITHNAYVYKSMLTTTEKKKLPNTRTIRKSNEVITVNFGTKDFIEGMSLYGYFAGYINNGEGTIFS